jgi:hypothetical protein
MSILRKFAAPLKVKIVNNNINMDRRRQLLLAAATEIMMIQRDQQ